MRGFGTAGNAKIAGRVTVTFPSSLAAGFGVVFAALFLRARLNYLRLPPLPERPRAGPLPDCMVVIPARNEEATIGRAVRSLPPDSVIVVDDFSEDATASEAQAAGAGVLKAPELPRGASGKANACWLGGRVLTSRWILFADADTWYEPGFLDSAVAAAEAGQVDLLSIQPGYEPGGWLERILVPYAEALFFSGVNPQKEPAAAFNGQCLLFKRQAYEFLGGHGAVLFSPVDDVRFAYLADRHRMSKALSRAPRLAHARLHAGWRGLRCGIRRNAVRFTQVDTKLGLTILAAAATAAFWLPLVGWLAATHQIHAAAALLALGLLVLAPWYRARVWLAPAAVYFMLPVLFPAAAAVAAQRKLEWKGRPYG